jgi:diguanylate cyclase (GGDEF)-like protein
MKVKATAYIWTVNILGVVILFAKGESLVNPSQLIMGILAMALADFFSIPLQRADLSFGFAVTLFALLTGGVYTAIWVSVAGGFIAEGVRQILHMGRKRPIALILFNNLQQAICIFAAAFAAGLVRPVVNFAQVSVMLVLEVIMYSILSLVINHAMVYTYWYIQVPEALTVASVRESVAWDLITYAVCIPTGYLMVVVNNIVGLLGIAAVFIPLVAVGQILRMYKLVRESERQLLAVYTAAVQVNSSLVGSVVAEVLAKSAREAALAEGSVVYRQDPARDLLVPIASSGDLGRKFFTRLVQDGEGIIGRAAAARETQITDDYTSYPHRVRDVSPEDVDFASVMAVPLIAEDQVVGVLAVVHPDASYFDERHQRLVTIIAAYGASSMRNASQYRQVNEKAITDSLTGIYNRGYIEQELGRTLRAATEKCEEASVVMFDLDHFKAVNDSSGHPAGDAVLAEIINRCRKVLRSDAIFGRYGGDEFVLVLPGLNGDAAMSVAERLREAVASKTFRTPDGLEHMVTLSLGVATFPEDATTPAELIDKADHACYCGAKHIGRNRVGLYREVQAQEAKQWQSNRNG